MATVRSLRTFLSLASVGATATLVASSSTIRTTFTQYFYPTTHPWRFLLLLFSILLNAKSLPLAWHLRLFWAMINQLYVQPTSLPVDALFRPTITKSMYSPLNECDYNLHKSNSTYFADLDIARTNLVSALLRKGIRATTVGSKATLKSTSAANSTTPGKYMVALGGVTCHFKREIKPYERYEIWTRILSWDKKWFYIMSHIVKEGAVQPNGWALHPDRKPSGKNKPAKPSAEELKKAIFATSIAKYVVKKGRLTIPPETVFSDSDLLPERPLEGSNGRAHHDASEWSWHNIEAERLRGLELAKHFDALDGLHDEFPVSRFGEADKSTSIKVLGEFQDIIW